MRFLLFTIDSARYAIPAETVLEMPDGLVLIHDVDTFLSGVEALTLDTALALNASTLL